jgi:hypothetical protein
MRTLLSLFMVSVSCMFLIDTVFFFFFFLMGFHFACETKTLATTQQVARVLELLNHTNIYIKKTGSCMPGFTFVNLVC